MGREIYLNGIIEALFIISIFATIKYPTFILVSLALAAIAIIINVRIAKSKKR